MSRFMALALILFHVPLFSAQDRADPIALALDRARARPEQERWRLLPWERSLTATLKKASALGKPVFYFGYDGVLDTGNS